jgi:pyruvate,water dikinase
MSRFVLSLHEIDQSQVATVGGKGANLGELSKIDGIRVPAGFCVTTDAFRLVMAEVPSLDDQLDMLAQLNTDDREPIRTVSAQVRGAIEEIVMPDEIAVAINEACAEIGANAAYAVRSSATAEDLPTASFAGQQDTYLNVVGTADVLAHVRKCWASLFTERAVTYRLRNGIDHRKVRMAVVVQRMVFPQAAGILFTADPISGNRKIASVEASFGLGEALVSGLVNADVYKVRDGQIVSRTLGAKHLAVVASPLGGTRQEELEPRRREQPALTDAQVVDLARLGRRIEAQFGNPQDIEWCLDDRGFHIVQSRPITTLFPIPEPRDGENHVYVSVGHQQMMTDPFKPFGLSFWQMTALSPMSEAGGRLFVDVTKALAAPASRDNMIKLFTKSDPLIGGALQAVVDRAGFIPPPPPNAGAGWSVPGSGHPPLEADPNIPAELIARSEASIATLEHEIETLTGTALLDFIRQSIQERKGAQVDPLSMRAILAGMEAAWWLNDKLEEWLGEKNAADTLAQSVPNNVTSEMGLAFLDVADAIRPHPDVVAFLENVKDERFLGELPKLEGGAEARDAIQSWLDKYGMRAVGEIDITRPRWIEHPSTIVPVLLGNIRNFEPGEAKRRFAQGEREAANKERELLSRLRALPDGEAKAAEVKRMIDRLRIFAGYREYPKYAMISRNFVYKRALMEEAERLVHAGVLREKDDIFYLRFDELQDVVRTQRADQRLIREREDAFVSYQALTPPRVLTSEGEAVKASYGRSDFPPGALVGLAVSAGAVEGRARVVLDLGDANIEPNDILVTAYTDPSWTPLFVAIKGLVTEVGGLMTHGAVIAREYGLPAVVGVERATQLIRDGQRIRVHGTEGYVEILSD